jgi:menaquinone-dependent protoporphyrinogen oxidase
MPNILIVYDTTEGQTRQIAQHVADAATGLGHQVELHEIRRLPSDFTVGRFNGVIVGAPIHMGKHSKRLAQFVGKRRVDLERKPAAFFSVSLSAAGTESERTQAEKYVGEFLAQIGWRPQMTATFGGGLLYREYGFLKRWMMTKIARDAGKDTDTSRNYDYTDWATVDRFLKEFLAGLGPERQKS